MKQQLAKENFITAFWQLYAEKDISNISVAQVCQIAGYNRTTFYVYFDNLYGLLEIAITHLIEPIKGVIYNLSEQFETFEATTLQALFISVFEKENAYLELVFQREHSYLLCDELKRAFLTLMKQRVQDEKRMEHITYLFEYQISAVFGVFRYWFQTGKKLPQKELIQKLYEVTTMGTLTVLQKELKKH